jgi:hypothetical protein
VKGKTVEIEDTISVKEFAEKAELSPAKVIGELMKNGILASINQILDYEIKRHKRVLVHAYAILKNPLSSRTVRKFNQPRLWVSAARNTRSLETEAQESNKSYYLHLNFRRKTDAKVGKKIVNESRSSAKTRLDQIGNAA